MTHSVGLGIFSPGKLWYRGCCTPVALSSPDIRGTRAMITSWKILGEAKRRWVPTQEVNASHAGGTTSGSCPSGALPPPYASAIGAAFRPSSGAALQSSDRGQLRYEIRHSPKDRFNSEQPGEVYNVADRPSQFESFD